jgi:hypothetical protein
MLELQCSNSLDYIVAVSLEHKSADCSWLSNVPERDASQG